MSEKTLWQSVLDERPKIEEAEKSWPAFFIIVGLYVAFLPIYLPIRFLIELVKYLNQTRQPAKTETDVLREQAQEELRKLPSREKWPTMLTGVLHDLGYKHHFASSLEPVTLSVVEQLIPESLEPPERDDDISLARYRDKLQRIIDDEDYYTSISRALVRIYSMLCDAVPQTDASSDVTTQLRDIAANPNALVNDILYWSDNEPALAPINKKMKQNAADLSPQSRIIPVMDYKGDPADYLRGTPFEHILDIKVPVSIPQKSRFEHQWVVGGSGHGKTQALQYLISQDLDRVAAGECSVIVMDSQGDMIERIKRLKMFADGEPLHSRLVVIDPTDIEYPVALNLFDVGVERLQHHEPLERERLTNSILELYDFVLGSLLSAELTQKQSVIFRYITRLMMHIPDANIQTFRELMEPHGYEKYKPYIEKLRGTARAFFETEFNSKEFEATKRQVVRRLWGILENQTFERMFSHPRNKLDLFKEMNTGNVILINTAKDLLKQNGTEIFGRFFIAMITQAAQERATLPPQERLPCYVYVDECQDYVDQNVSLILEQARKYNIGMVLAHQYIGQLAPKIQESFAANTSIKFAGGVSDKDARAFAHMLRTTPEFIEQQRQGSFAAHIRNVYPRALSMAFPFGYLEHYDGMSDRRWQAIRAHMRARYAVHYSEVEQHISGSFTNGDDDDPSDDPTQWA